MHATVTSVLAFLQINYFADATWKIYTNKNVSVVAGIVQVNKRLKQFSKF